MNLARILVQSLNIAYLYLYRLSDSVENIIRYCKKANFLKIEIETYFVVSV